MKGKVNTYILLVAVVVVWGIIGFRIFSSINPETHNFSANEIETTFNPKTKLEKDTFSIQNVERDPFLGILSKTKNKQNTRSKKIIKKENTNKSITISYHGLLKLQPSKEKIFIVKINGRESLIKRGQTIDSVKLIDGNEKHVIMSYKNIRRTLTVLK